MHIVNVLLGFVGRERVGEREKRGGGGRGREREIWREREGEGVNE